MPRPKSITLAPTALDRNGITTAETLVAARLSLLINGALATGYDRDGIAASQTPSGADAMTLNGAVGTDLSLRGGGYVLIYAAANDTGRTFTVVGENYAGHAITEDITGPGTGLITLGSTVFYSITSVTPDAATAGAIEIGVNGYVLLSTPQHIAAYSAGNDTGDTFTFTGLNRYGGAMTEDLTGSSAGTTAGALNFSRIDKVASSGASAGAVEMGIDGLAETQWRLINYRGGDFNVGLGVDVVSGTLTYAVQHTFHDIMGEGYVEGDETVFTHDTLTGKSADADGNYTNPPRAIRAAITAFTSGSLIFHIVQAGR